MSLPHGLTLGRRRVSVAAVVLAGGASRRMGADKATLDVGGSCLAERVVGVASTVAGVVALVAPVGHPALALVAEGGPLLGAVRVVHDPGDGPLAAIVTAFGALQAPWVVLLATDHPDLRSELLALLLALRGTGQAVVARREARLEPLVGVYDRVATLAAARQCIRAGEHALHRLLARLDITVVEESTWRIADPQGASFADLDTPQELRARRTQ